MNLNLAGKTALITGGGSGLGLATAKNLNKEGVRTILFDKNFASFAENDFANKQLVETVTGDVRNPEELAKLHQDLKTQNKAVDIIINCAGITGAQGDFSDISLEDWQEVFDINLFGSVNVTKEFLSDLQEKKWGRVLFLASEDAMQPYDDEIPYCATKAGILALSKGLAKTLGPQGITSNAVSPAFINTPMTDKMMQNRADERNVSFDEAIQSFLKERRPFMTSSRRGYPEEVANVITFLCSEKASFVNGANYRVDDNSVGTI
ncbi:short-chain dehydrogenase/oxidoreductase [Tetragenococcus halophilus]|uniref:SDR family NAD(P)-dependent oxidoreductase n=1 Tax=Tetragenococcus halophilus TaxID=51669 RepID=UPI001928F403|nr:SDR family oxidoreductase [Tetragenococcus halophilus]MDN6164143.1 SDR family oxidoreductase [Tetragenococcus halophilus]MDN6265981.1 SDR family oxidoreductase [Tetragenococcus halophilus]MDN6408781.1 SDR family oxidoreductase [Tetragenococcus halophilus]MDN6840122.1 SDR family oxidoreductase [Tetragenococcus halophilus]GEQ37635.1 short-chain dehydrogenase/oxidoreductase [Tetragenococcus halophilus]